jgi:uncharacterized membrane protein
MSKLSTVIGAFGLGAGLMYFFDPKQGRRRQAFVRDKAIHALHQLDEGMEKAGEDLRNRSRGVLAEVLARFSEAEPYVPDWLLVERARSRLGGLVSHPRSIHMTASQGRLMLEGPILAHEVEPLLARLNTIRDVRGVENHLEVHELAENIPGLQGEARPRASYTFFGLWQENWTPGIRLLTALSGGLLSLYGWRRGGLIGAVWKVFGFGLAFRGLTNIPWWRLFVGSTRAIDVQKTINIQAPVEQVYTFWSSFTNFPEFMAHVRDVQDLGGGRSHWTVAGPAGIPVEWEARITEQIPNELIAWTSEPGQVVRSTGQVSFEPNPDGSTRLHIRLSYNPPAGALGHAVATLFGADPKQTMDEDLMRLKSLLENGKTTAKGQEVLFTA